MLSPPRLTVTAGVLVCLAAALPAALPAQTVPGRPTMADVVAFARHSSPEAATARQQVDSVLGEQRIARALPNPAFTVTPGSPFQYSVTQPVDLGPYRVLRMRAAGQGASAVRFDVVNTTRQVVFAVRQAFLDLLLAEANRGVTFEQDTIVRHLLEADSLRYAEGDLALRDLSTTELQSAHADAALARADAATRDARITLQVLMGVPHPDTAFRVSGTLEYRALQLPLDSLHDMALANRPDLAAAGERVRQSESLRSLASSLLVPVPGVAAIYQPAPFPSGSNYALGVSLSLPVWYWFSGERQRASAGLHSAEIVREHTVATVEGDVVAAADNFRAARTLASRYAGGLLAKARATLDMQRFAYEHGNASLLDLLNAISVFGDTQNDYYTAVHDYWVAAYAIDRAVGRDLVP